MSEEPPFDWGLIANGDVSEDPIVENVYGALVPFFRWDTEQDKIWRAAKAAVGSLRPPSEAMVEAAAAVIRRRLPLDPGIPVLHVAAEVWKAMVEIAAQEEPQR